MAQVSWELIFMIWTDGENVLLVHKHTILRCWTCAKELDGIWLRNSFVAETTF